METLPIILADRETDISVDLDRSIDLADKKVRSIEADGSREQPERENHQSGVAEVQKGRNKLRDFQLNRQQTTTI